MPRNKRALASKHQTIVLRGGSIVMGAFWLSIGCGQHGLSTGDQLSLTVTPITTASTVSGVASVCGASESMGCVPGLGRRAEIAVKAINQESGLDVPDGLVVLLTADQGWLVPVSAEGSKDSDCLQEARPNLLRMTLSEGAGRATWCFGDAGATASLTASSGTILSTAQLQLAPVPRALQLWATPATVADGEAVTLTASLTDCQGNAVTGVPILFTVEGGRVDWGSNSPVVSSSAEGLAGLSGTMTTGPANISARVVRSSEVSCTLETGAAP